MVGFNLRGLLNLVEKERVFSLSYKRKGSKLEIGMRRREEEEKKKECFKMLKQLPEEEYP